MKPTQNIKIPVGRSGFADIRENGYYYVDKSRLIEELLRTEGIQAALITRPRRFGKTLAMNMLAEFFDIRKDSRPLFEGLAIAENAGLCAEWMNRYPTLFLSFRTVDGLRFENAYARLENVVTELYNEHFYLMDSDKLITPDKELFHRIAFKTASREEVSQALAKLTHMKAAHYCKPVVLLIDEYDVPLAKANEKGYYADMLDVIRDVMQTVKDNNSLKLAVITGCLRIAKESIFTGVNNLVSDTISDTRLNEFFGFTQAEVDQLLDDTGLSAHREEIREWYDGYRFGRCDVYCPWDVMNHINSLILNPSAAPKNYWENTSDNAIIRSFLKRTDFAVNDKFETLLAGGFIQERITDQLTYDMLESSEDNLWSLLYLTGYLTNMRPDEAAESRLMPGETALRIPNREIQEIFKRSVMAWFREKTRDGGREELFTALWDGNAEKLTEIISDLLFDTISYHDYRESFYHAFLTGLLSAAGYAVESNYENGLGRSDITLKDRKNRRAAVIEAKWTQNESRLDAECDSALGQIEEKQYAGKLERAGFRTVIRLGIAFCQKKCLVKRK